MYLALERKPDNGGEIQNLANIALGIMLHLKVVKSANEEKAIAASAAADAIASAAAAADNNIAAADKAGKGTQVLLELTEPWHHSGRLVTADAYFASMEAALAMKEKGLTFIGNVKKCSRRFSMEFLGNTILPQRGSQAVLASIDEEIGETELVAVSSVDRNRRFFVTTTCGIGEGEDVFRKRLRQLDKSGRAPPDKVIIKVAQPKAIATYYKGASTIDRHNRIRIDELRMDRNLATRHWDKRFNLRVLGIICVHAYLFFQQGSMRTTRRQAASNSFASLRTSSSTTTRGFEGRGRRRNKTWGRSQMLPLHQSLPSGGPFGSSTATVDIMLREGAASRTA
jgi:hypothetical protein